MLYINEKDQLCIFNKVVSEKVDYFLNIGVREYLYLYNNKLTYFTINKKDNIMECDIINVQLCGIAPIRKFYAQRCDDFIKIAYKNNNKWSFCVYVYYIKKLVRLDIDLVANKLTKVGHGFLIDNLYVTCDGVGYRIINPDEYIFTRRLVHHIKNKPVILNEINVQWSEVTTFLDKFVLVYKDEVYRLCFNEKKESPKYVYECELVNGKCYQTRCDGIVFNTTEGKKYINSYEIGDCNNYSPKIIKEFNLF
jgi:hypothetical protein